MRHKIDFIEKTVGIREISSKFIEFYKSFRNNNKYPVLEISFSQEVQIIDEVFYSYLLLFLNEFKDTKVEINFNQNPEGLYKVALSNISFIYNFYSKNISIKGAELNDFKISDKIIPPLLINSFENNRFFKKNKEWKLFVDFDAPKIKQDLNKLITDKRKFYSYLQKSINISGGVFQLSNYHFLGILNDLDLLRYHYLICDNVKNPTKYSDNTIRSIADLQKRYNLLIEEKFFDFSEFEMLLFRIILKEKYTKEIQQTSFLKYLIKYVKDLVAGIKELTNNIVEHSGQQTNDGVGVFSARIFNKEKFENIKYLGDESENWMKNVSSDVFIDINIIDNGFEDLKAKYIDKLQEISKDFKNYKEIILDDINILEEQEFNYSKLFNYNDISLYYQKRREISKIGLLLFSQKILENNGYIQFSTNSNNQNSRFFIYQNSSKQIVSKIIDKIPSIGTSYNFLLPLSSLAIQKKNANQIRNPQLPSFFDKNIFKELLSYKIINKNDQSVSFNSKSKGIIENLPTNDIRNIKEKHKKISFLKNFIISTCQENNSIFLINAHHYNDLLLTPSEWTRLLFQIPKNICCIIYNIEEDIILNIIEINQLFEKAGGFWTAYDNILFYYKSRFTGKQSGKTLSLWFNCLLSGTTFEEFLSKNKQISFFNYNIFGILDHKKDDVIPSREFSKNLLFSENTLLNFELLIKIEQLCLFEHGLKSLLQLEITRWEDGDKDNTIKSLFFTKFKGFKIVDSHFKLGSKIHIKDFYYAKRVFYNSFYSYRLSFLVVKILLENHLAEVHDKKNFKLTLIGYEKYSNLLLSNIRNLLNEEGFEKINHDIYLPNNKVSKNVANINERAIIVVPISSTFSTSLKIREGLKMIVEKNNKAINFEGSDVSVILVKDHKNFNNSNIIKKEDDYVEDDLYKVFKWDVGSYDATNRKVSVNGAEQSFLLELTTQWESIYDCQLCFEKELENKNYEQEVCLLETESNNVTPDLIFDFPKNLESREQKIFELFFNENDYYSEKEKKVINPYIFKRRVKIYKSTYSHYIRTGALINNLDRHENILSKWLQEIQKSTHNLTDKKIVVLTPSTTNSKFTNIVNKILFNSTATILQFSASDDNIQNFIKFHNDILEDSKIIFIDDVIGSGMPYWNISEYIKNALPKKSIAIDLCICLINRMNYYNEKLIIKECNDNFYYFVKLNLSEKIDSEDYDYINTKIKGYKKLAKKSLLDSSRVYFKQEIQRIKPLQITTKANDENDNSDETALLTMILFHKINYFFRVNKEDGNYENLDDINLFFEDSQKALNNLLKIIKEDRDVIEFCKKFPYLQYEIDLKTIQILSEPPFSRYKNLKNSVFQWTLKNLKELKINEDIFDHNYNNQLNAFSKYQNLKLLLRIAVNLKTNYIFSKDFLLKVKELNDLINDINPKKNQFYYQKKYIPNEIDPNVSEFSHFDITKKEEEKCTIIRSLGFNTYFSCLVQELIVDDEAKAIQLIKNIVKIIRDKEDILKGLTLKNDFENSFVDLLRMLVLENNFIFENFFQNFYFSNKIKINLDEKDEFTIEQYFLKDEIEKYYESNHSVEPIKRAIGGYNHLKDTFRPDNDLKEAFFNTIALKTYLKSLVDEKDTFGSIKISEKIRIILKKLCEILNIKNGGAYFSILYKKNTTDISENDIYIFDNYSTDEKVGKNRHTKDKYKLEENLFDNNCLLKKVYTGLQDENGKMPKTIFELVKKSNTWKYKETQDLKEEYVNDALETNFDFSYDNLLFLRITNIEKEKLNHISYPSAVITFFSEGFADNSRFDPKRVRFLLLLRDYINEFIYHELDNDTLLSFIEEETKNNIKINLGHGFDTLLKSTKDDLSYIENSNKKESLLKNIELFSNKINLIKTLQSPENIKTYETSIISIINCFKDQINHVFSFSGDTFVLSLKDKNYFRLNIEYHLKVDEKFAIPGGLKFVNDLVFEILYNIRKHVISCKQRNIGEEKPLIVTINTIPINDKFSYLCISNNFCDIHDEKVKRLNKKILYKKKNDGLNLLNKILPRDEYTIHFSKLTDDTIMIKIPLKKYEI